MFKQIMLILAGLLAVVLFIQPQEAPPASTAIESMRRLYGHAPRCSLRANRTRTIELTAIFRSLRTPLRLAG